MAETNGLAIRLEGLVPLLTVRDLSRWIEGETDAFPRHEGLSHHADGSDLARWILDNAHPHDLVLTHARLERTIALLEKLRRTIGPNSRAPRQRET